MIDLNAWRDPESLVDSLYAARRGDRRDLAPQVTALLDHEEPIIREEAASLLLAKWKTTSLRERAVTMLDSDPDVGVRCRVAVGLASVSTRTTRNEDLRLLRTVLGDSLEELQVRRSVCEALCLLLNRRRATDNGGIRPRFAARR